MSKQYENSKDGRHHVYLLPVEDYVGKTQSTQFRWSRHKNHYGRNIEGARVLYSTYDKAEALELEALLHDMGYKGRNRTTFTSEPRPEKRKPILQFDKQGSFIKKWDGQVEAAKGLGIHQSGIGCVLAGKYGSTGGYVFKYA